MSFKTKGCHSCQQVYDKVTALTKNHWTRLYLMISIGIDISTKITYLCNVPHCLIYKCTCTAPNTLVKDTSKLISKT